MSQETVLPLEGPSGPEEKHAEESSLLFSNTHEACDGPNGPPDPKVETGSSAQRDASPGIRRGSSTSSDLIRKQPQALRREGGTCPSQTRPLEELGRGKGGHHGVPHSREGAGKYPSSLSGRSDSSGSSGSHKPGLPPEDCCLHCILACLFCEFLALCDMALSQASCGACTSESCCCCCCGADELGDDCGCPCDADCGIVDACCESSDCLEICMECCGICFPT